MNNPVSVSLLSGDTQNIQYLQMTHNSTIGKALAYNINQEEYLRVFLSDGNAPMDNKYAEQAIRPFTIGRKNFVMIESSKDYLL